LLEFYSAHPDALDRTMPIKKVMIKNPHTVTPEMLSIDALLLMRKHKIGCLPVVNDGKLLGVITELNFMNFSEETIQALIRDSEQVRGGK
ncbi:MAG: CBS domain-containing protein, partial [Calditrichaeota bacterium]|nr:CBS domain-containing protein [Calditrichota bacterium]